MDNNLVKQPNKMNVMAIVALACSSVGLIMAILGLTLYCACSASKTAESELVLAHSNSAVMVVAILGAFIAVAGIVFAIIAYKQKAVKMATVSIIVSVFAFFYAIIPTITVCGYNCSLNGAYEDMTKEAMGGFGSALDGLGDSMDDLDGMDWDF